MKLHHYFLALAALGFSFNAATAQESTPVPDAGEQALVENTESTPVTVEQTVAADYAPMSQVIPEAERLGGPITTYRKKDSLYWELTGSQYDADYICVISIARGIGTADVYGGQSIAYGNDMIWRFRKVEDRVQLVRRNYRYRADDGPDKEALRVAFTDSVVFSLPIVARGPQGGDVVDVTSLFMSDSLSMVGSRYLGGYSFARDRSTWEKVKALKDNIELEVAATYAGPYGSSETIVDTRGVGVNIHYSISKMKDTGYKPRLADERVGYFNSAVRDVSNKMVDDNFVRYINRWNLQKLEPNAEMSLPKKPIVYWLDKATPFEYRKAMRDAVLEWNKAFEKAGFYNAIEVRQQEDNDDWDPEDINYNAIRWSSTLTGFSIGPSRVNPATGEILDADVVLSVGFLSSWTRQFELYKPEELLDKFTGRGYAVDEELERRLYDESNRIENAADKELFYAQQFGLANTFFDVMMVNDVEEDPAPAPAAETASSEPEAAPAPAEDATVTEDEKAQIASAREIAQKSAEAAEKATTIANEASEEARQAKEALAQAKEAEESARKALVERVEALEKKAEDAKVVAEAAQRVADDSAKRLAEIENFVNELKKERQAAAEAKAAAEKEAQARAEADKAKAEQEKAVAERKKRLEAERAKMIDQGLRSLVTHEVGHTLGLRHNFYQSALHSLDEINDASKWTEHGYVGSIMEYAPVNVMPKGEKQGDYFSYHIGEYDEWVIEYGYRVFPGKTTESEKPELEKIASKQSQRQYRYSTDEDCYGVTKNPYVNIWDLGSSPLEYAKVRARLVDQLLPGLNERIVKNGESFAPMRSRYNMLVNWKVNGMVFAANYIGGLVVSRDFKGDEGAQKPFAVVPAKDQRDALAFLAKDCFGSEAFQIPSELFDYLAPNRWMHWGSNVPSRYDYDVHANVLAMQTSILNQLLSSSTLGRLADAEMRVPEGEDVFTSAEMISTLNEAIFSEWHAVSKGLKENAEGRVEMKLASTRRNLQRAYLQRLSSFALSSDSSAAMGDMSAVARMKLVELANELDQILASDRVDYKSAKGRGDDAYAKAFLLDVREKIKLTLDPVQTTGDSSGGIVISF